MIYDVSDMKINIEFKNETIELPEKVYQEAMQNFNDMLKNGANIWNGDVICISSFKMENQEINIICKKTTYAHYLYDEKGGCKDEYVCRNLNAGCLIETKDGYYVIGEMNTTTAFPGVLQAISGAIDMEDILIDRIDLGKTVLREMQEEININLSLNDYIYYNNLKYMYISDENEKATIKFFSKLKLNMTAEDLQKHFEKYCLYLEKNNLELELKKLYFFNKEEIVEKLSSLPNPKREYLVQLIKKDMMCS